MHSGVAGELQVAPRAGEGREVGVLEAPEQQIALAVGEPVHRLGLLGRVVRRAFGKPHATAREERPHAVEARLAVEVAV